MKTQHFGLNNASDVYPLNALHIIALKVGFIPCTPISRCVTMDCDREAISHAQYAQILKHNK